MSVEDGPAIEHAPTRRTLSRTIWQAAGLLVVGALALWVGAASGPPLEKLRILAFAGVLLLGFGLIGLVAAELARTILARHPWRRQSGRLHLAPGRPPVLELRDRATRERVVVRAWYRTAWHRPRRRRARSEPYWLAVGRTGLGVASRGDFDEMLLVFRHRPGSRWERNLERTLERARAWQALADERDD